MIAVGAGDGALASRFALQARKSLPHEPLTHLLRAQSAELSGDRATARRIYEAMLASPETEQLGLRGLFLEAQREDASEAARQFAGRALNANPKLGWSSNALFEQQCKQKDWAAALLTLEHAKKHGHVAKLPAERKRAVLLTAKAQEAEDDTPEKALALALEAHGLAPDLVPAATLAGRILASRGNTGKAAKVAAEDLGEVAAPRPRRDLCLCSDRRQHARPPRSRSSARGVESAWIESPIAIATTATEARMYDEARRALDPLLAERLTQRVATLMARIEAGENGEKGRVREWLARAMNAARDPALDGRRRHFRSLGTDIAGRRQARRVQWRVPVKRVMPRVTNSRHASLKS